MSFEVIGVRLVAENADGFAGDMAKAQKAVDGFGQGSTATFRQMPGLADIAVGALHRIGEVAVNALGAAAQATGQFLTDSVSKAGDFQQGMLEFQAVAGKDVDTKGLDKFHDLFIQLGKDLPVSTKDVQDAAIELVKGGIDPATIAAGGLKQSIQFAAAAMGGDLKAAAETSAKIVGGWADVTATATDKANLLSHATDLLTKAANASTVDVHDLALGLYNVQGTAKTTGLSLDETTTALAELAPRFSSANTAGTSFRNFLVRLQPQTKNQTGAMEALGLYTEATGSKFFDAQGKFVGVAKASQMLQDATKNLTAEQKTNLLQTIFGNDAMNAAAALADLGAKGYDNMTASLDKANGVAENAALKQQGYNTALENAKGSVEALQITLGEKLLPILTDLLNNVIAPAVNTITTLSDAVFGNKDAFDKLSPPLQTIVGLITDLVGEGGGIGVFADDIREMTGIDIMPIVTAIQGLVAEIQLLLGLTDPATVVDFWDQAFGPDVTDTLMTIGDFLKKNLIPILFGVGTAILVGVVPPMLTATTAFVAAAAPIVALIAVGALLYKAWTEDWGGIQEITASVWKTVEPIFENITEWLGKNIPVAVKTVSDFWTNTLYPALKTVWDFIDTYIIPIFLAVVGVSFKAMEVELGILAGIWNNVLWPALQKVWSFLSTFVIPLFTAIVNVNIALFQLSLRELAAVWTGTLYPAIETAYNWLHDKIAPVFDTVSGKADDMAKVVRDTLGPALSWLGDTIIQPVVGWFDSIASKVQNLIGYLNDLAEKIRNLPSIPDPFHGGSPPPLANWMGAIADQTHRAASAFGSLSAPITAMPSSPMAMMAAGNTTNMTNNNQRSVNLNYNTTYAPPPSTSLAIANALGAY
jgi:TP901 family phage tail tape measure protein